jgi:membrane protein YqaA with SNARE-associated domain
MRALFYSLFGYFLTAPGVMLMAMLDASVIFFLPLGIDFVVVILAARDADRFWLYALLATIGSLLGATGTFWIGRKVGEHGLARLINPRRLERVRDTVSSQAAVAVALLAIIPPPFPFTAFVLASGAIGVNAWTFLTTLAAARAVRFLAEAALAALYGRRILGWMQSTVFEAIIAVMVVLAVVGTAMSAATVFRRRSTRATGAVGESEGRSPSD